MANSYSNLISGRRLATNTIWNLLGGGLPLLVAIVAIPVLLDKMGAERFGVLTLAWMVVGYFSVFDLGLGRALTKLTAERIAAGARQEIPAIVWSALALLGILGLAGAVILFLLAPWLVGSVLEVPPRFQSETLSGFYLLAASLPIVISTAGLRGVLEGFQRFALVNTVRIPLGILTFLGPLAVLPLSKEVPAVVSVLVFVRLIAWFVHIKLCFLVAPELRKFERLDAAAMRALIGFGGWMTVSNIVGPLMVYMDRFLIGAVVSLAAVAYYGTPYEVVTKLWIFPAALVGVLFPAFAQSFGRDQARTVMLLERGVNYIYLCLFPIVFIVVTLAYEGLSLWVGADFAAHSFVVLQLLAVGVFVNSLAHVPVGLLQGVGRPDLTAKLHMLELPFYLLILWWLLGEYGIVGAALAWLIRASVDAVILFVIAVRVCGTEVPRLLRSMALKVFLALVLFLGGALTQGLLPKLFFASLTCLLFVPAAWFFVLSQEERSLLLQRMKWHSGFNA